MQPLVNYVSNFDATLDYKLEFTYLGSEYIVTNHVEIREDRLNSEPIYSRESTKFDKNHTIPAHTLQNGKSYRVKVRVFENDSTWSVWSPEETFTCLRTPSVIFENLEEDKYVYNNDILFRAFFQQEQGDRVDTYQFILMNSNMEALYKYPVRRPEAHAPNVMQERIKNLEKGKLYYLGINIHTRAGIDFITSHEFVSHYVAPSTPGIVHAKSDRDNGTVMINAYIKQSLGIQVAPNLVEDEDDNMPFVPVEYTYINDEKIVIPPHRPLMYTRLGMAQASDFIMKIWCQNIPNGPFITFQTENNNGVGLRLEKRDDCVVMVKEFLNDDDAGIMSTHRSNIIPDLGRKEFYLYLKVIEFRPEIHIELV